MFFIFYIYYTCPAADMQVLLSKSGSRPVPKCSGTGRLLGSSDKPVYTHLRLIPQIVVRGVLRNGYGVIFCSFCCPP